MPLCRRHEVAGAERCLTCEAQFFLRATWLNRLVGASALMIVVGTLGLLTQVVAISRPLPQCRVITARTQASFFPRVELVYPPGLAASRVVGAARQPMLLQARSPAGPSLLGPVFASMLSLGALLLLAAELWLPRLFRAWFLAERTQRSANYW